MTESVTSDWESDDERRYFIGEVVRCYEVIAELEFTFPVDEFIHEVDDDLPQEVIDRLESLKAALFVIQDNAPKILMEFSKAVEIDGEVKEHLDKIHACERADDARTSYLVEQAQQGHAQESPPMGN